jgi:diguanylate cyclase (GGDEF)-like protein
MKYAETSSQRSKTQLLDRFYNLFLVVCIVYLTIGVPFIFLRKAAAAAFIVVTIAALLGCKNISRRGHPQKSLKLFATGMWLLLTGLIFLGLPASAAVTAMALALAMMLAVIVDLRAGVVFGVGYLLGWLAYIGLNVAQLAPTPYFTGTPITSWFVSAVSFWLVLLPAPELVQSLHKAASLQKAVIEATTDGILVVNNEGNLETYNQRFVDLWGIPPALLSTRDDRTLLDHVVQQLADPDQFMRKVVDLYAHPEQTSRDTLVFKDGRIFERYSHPQLLDTQVVGRVWSFRDITEQEKTRLEVHRLAFHDDLTSLPNRRLLIDRLQQALASCQRTGQSGALLFVDLDNFKALNDKHGHAMGDLLLIEVAGRLSGSVRSVDTVARHGGDEFVVLLGGLEAEIHAARIHVSRVAEKIRQDLANPYLLIPSPDAHGAQGVQHDCTGSIGVVMFSGIQRTANELLDHADAAMYRAKERGRNMVNFHDLMDVDTKK